MNIYLVRVLGASLFLGGALIGQHAKAAKSDALTSPEEVLAMLHAKINCSNAFISGLDIKRTTQEDLLGFGVAESLIDKKKNIVTSRIGPTIETAIYTPHIGCTPLIGESEASLRKRQMKIASLLKNIKYAEVPLEVGRNDISVNYELVDRLIDSAFKEETPGSHKNTRAIIVLHKGQIIGERYADGVTVDSALGGFSMTKSILNIVTGIMVKQKLLDINQPVNLDSWQSPDDRRGLITFNDLMRMKSGLVWNENYSNPMSDPILSLFGSHDSSTIAASRQIYMSSNSYYNYSSGDAQILSSAISKILKKSRLNAATFPYRFLFSPLGMKTAQLEADGAGNPLYAAFMYASGRDWVRFGQFLLADGKINDRMLVPSDWLKNSTTPTAESDGQQGILFAVNKGILPRWPSLPTDTFAALGFRGQRLIVIPSKSLVILRLGASVPEEAWDVENFAAGIINALNGSAIDPVH